MAHVVSPRPRDVHAFPRNHRVGPKAHCIHLDPPSVCVARGTASDILSGSNPFFASFSLIDELYKVP